MVRRSLRFFAASFTVALLTTGAARAETEGPTPVPGMLSEILEYIGDALSKSEAGARLEMSAEASAAAVGESVKMKFPAPRIVAEDGSWIQMEDTAARVTPMGGKAFEFSLELPHALTVSDKNGRPDERIDWRGGGMRGVWRADLETLPIIHGNVHDVVLTDQSQTPEHNDGTIETISVDQELIELSPGLWSGPSVFEVTKLEIHPAGKAETFSFDRLSLIGETNNFDLPAWQALTEVLDTAPVFDEAEFSVDDQQIVRAAQIIADMHGGAGNFVFTLSGLRFGSQIKRLFSLRQMTLNMAYDNDARPGEYSLALSLTGLEQGEISIPPVFYPRLAVLKLHLERFPLRQILTFPLREPALAADSQTGQFDATLAKILLPLIYANRTVVQFDTVVLRSDAATLKAQGRFNAEETSALGIVGKAEIMLTGLDKLIAEAARQAKSGEQAPEALAMLTFAKGLGRAEINAEGELAYLFDILLSPSGAITINEIPLDLMQNSGLPSLPFTTAQHAAANVQKSL